jgi:hypothetical protein
MCAGLYARRSRKSARSQGFDFLLRNVSYVTEKDESYVYLYNFRLTCAAKQC